MINPNEHLFKILSDALLEHEPDLGKDADASARAIVTVADLLGSMLVGLMWYSEEEFQGGLDMVIARIAYASRRAASKRDSTIQ